MRAAAASSCVALMMAALVCPAVCIVSTTDCPEGCRCQGDGQQVSCVALASIPGLFSHSIKSLNITLHRIKNLSRTSFTGLEQLEELEVTDGRLFQIAEDSFSSLRNLRRLNISHNELTWLSPDALLTCHDLTLLDLSWNALMLPTAGPMLASVSLSVLHMNSCSLTTLSDDVFSGMPALTIVSLLGNDLQAVPDCIVQNLEQLEIDSEFEWTVCTSREASAMTRVHSLREQPALYAYRQVSTLPLLWISLVAVSLKLVLVVAWIYRGSPPLDSPDEHVYGLLGGHQEAQSSVTPHNNFGICRTIMEYLGYFTDSVRQRLVNGENP